jgi:hypothetical protein
VNLGQLVCLTVLKTILWISCQTADSTKGTWQVLLPWSWWTVVCTEIGQISANCFQKAKIFNCLHSQGFSLIWVNSIFNTVEVVSGWFSDSHTTLKYSYLSQSFNHAGTQTYCLLRRLQCSAGIILSPLEFTTYIPRKSSRLSKAIEDQLQALNFTPAANLVMTSVSVNDC